MFPSRRSNYRQWPIAQYQQFWTGRSWQWYRWGTKLWWSFAFCLIWGLLCLQFRLLCAWCSGGSANGWLRSCQMTWNLGRLQQKVARCRLLHLVPKIRHSNLFYPLRLILSWPGYLWVIFHRRLLPALPPNWKSLQSLPLLRYLDRVHQAMPGAINLLRSSPSTM